MRDLRRDSRNAPDHQRAILVLPLGAPPAVPMSVTSAGERVSHREILLADLVEDGRLDILTVTAEALRNSVESAVAGRPVRQRLYYLTFEIIVGEEDVVDEPYYGGEAA